MKVVIVKYNAGNVRSVSNALERLGIHAEISSDPMVIRSADKVIFPGVGEASTAMMFLKETKLDQTIKELKQPFLGICLGLQLMCRHSEENDTDCLGIFDIDVKKFSPKLKVPHMGWNTLLDKRGALMQDIPEPSYVYYVHSYYAELSPYTIAATNYIETFSAALQKDNFFAIQAHPEKSGATGAKLLSNFIQL